jgi:hypothetical protein
MKSTMIFRMVRVIAGPPALCNVHALFPGSCCPAAILRVAEQPLTCFCCDLVLSLGRPMDSEETKVETAHSPTEVASGLRSRVSMLASSPSSIRWLIPLVVALAGLLIALAGQRSLVRTTDELTTARFQEETRTLANSVSQALASADPLLDSLRDGILAAAPQLSLVRDAQDPSEPVLGTLAHQFADAALYTRVRVSPMATFLVRTRSQTGPFASKSAASRKDRSRELRWSCRPVFADAMT